MVASSDFIEFDCERASAVGFLGKFTRTGAHHVVLIYDRSISIHALKQVKSNCSCIAK